MLTLPPVKGEISLAGVLPLAGVGGSSRTRVVVEYIIILIIIIVGPPDRRPAHFCQTVHLESLLFSESAFLHSKTMGRHPDLLFFFHFSYALEGRI